MSNLNKRQCDTEGIFLAKPVFCLETFKLCYLIPLPNSSRFRCSLQTLYFFAIFLLHLAYFVFVLYGFVDTLVNDGLAPGLEWFAWVSGFGATVAVQVSK